MAPSGSLFGVRRASRRGAASLTLEPFETALGFRLLLDPAGDDFHAILAGKRLVEPETHAFLEAALRPGDTVVDGGANVGMMTLHASRIVGAAGKVVAFEPQPETFRMLSESVRLNGARNVVLRAIGLSDAERTMRLYCFDPRNRGAYVLAGPTERDPVGVPVRLVPLDAELARLGLPRVDLVKLDIEGHELEALAGMRRLLEGRARPIVVLEVVRRMRRLHGDHRDPHRFLASRGFEAWELAFPEGRLALFPVGGARDLPRQAQVAYVPPAVFEERGLGAFAAERPAPTGLRGVLRGIARRLSGSW